MNHYHFLYPILWWRYCYNHKNTQELHHTITIPKPLESESWTYVVVDREVSRITKDRLGFLIMFTLPPSMSQRTFFLSFEVILYLYDHRLAWGWLSSLWLYSISHPIIYWGSCNDGVETRCLKGMLDKQGREKTWQTGGRLLDVFQSDQLLTRTAVPTDYHGR